MEGNSKRKIYLKAFVRVVGVWLYTLLGVSTFYAVTHLSADLITITDTWLFYLWYLLKWWAWTALAVGLGLLAGHAVWRFTDRREWVSRLQKKIELHELSDLDTVDRVIGSVCKVRPCISMG